MGINIVGRRKAAPDDCARAAAPSRHHRARKQQFDVSGLVTRQLYRADVHRPMRRRSIACCCRPKSARLSQRRPRGATFQLKTPFQKIGTGFAYVAAAPSLDSLADANAAPTRSKLLVYENGYPLGPPHTAHAISSPREWDGSLIFRGRESLFRLPTTPMLTQMGDAIGPCPADNRSLIAYIHPATQRALRPLRQWISAKHLFVNVDVASGIFVLAPKDTLPINYSVALTIKTSGV